MSNEMLQDLVRAEAQRRGEVTPAPQALFTLADQQGTATPLKESRASPQARHLRASASLRENNSTNAV
jgi:hypothetical protein